MKSKEITGLSTAQVERLVEQGKVNVDDSIKTRSLSDIARENILTLFNFVNVVLAIFVITTGQYKNMLFMVIILTNVCIGIIQEIRSKQMTDKLSIVATSQVRAVRDSQEVLLDHGEIVLGDILKLGRGDQVPTDSIVVQGSCQADESLLTGESDLIGKAEGDTLMSGSHIVSGVVYARASKVGADNYASKITSQAKAHKKVNSEIMKSLNAIIKYVSVILFPVGALLFSRSFFIDGYDYASSVLSSVSALVGMIPEGLILLTSTVLALSVIRLGKKNVLVQQLYCIETLARVDTLCLDKTGTITTGRMELTDIVVVDKESSDASVNSIIKSINAADDDKNETSKAIEAFYAKRYDVEKMSVEKYCPFSSDTKVSAAAIEGATYVLGAPQFVLKDDSEKFDAIHGELEELAKDSRVLLLAKTNRSIDSYSLGNAEDYTSKDKNSDTTHETTPLAFLCIKDEIRTSAKSTIHYFLEQGVDLKIISGDDPLTVSGIAKKVGVENSERWIDATTLKTIEDIESAIEKYTIFGRVKPDQKKMIVESLQKKRHTVAMTGDGVNDVLALKTSDCSIAMAAGSDAARNVAHLVLVDNDFAHMPEVVAEGRRSINNLQRSGSLFLVKTIMSLFLGLAFVFLPWQYPFTPIQMTLFSGLCIGFPSFVLALEPNHDIVRGHFLANCIVRSFPGGICAIISILFINVFCYNNTDLSFNQIATMCLIALCFLGVMLIIRLSIPYTPIRLGLTVCVIASLTIGIGLMPKVFDIATLNETMAIILVCVCGANIILYNLLFNFFVKRQEKSIEAEKSGECDSMSRLFKKYF